MPDSNVLKEEWKNSHGNEKYGIAYGFDEDEIAYAKETQHRAKERFEDIKRDQAKMIQSFINKCEDYFNA